MVISLRMIKAAGILGQDTLHIASFGDWVGGVQGATGSARLRARQSPNAGLPRLHPCKLGSTAPFAW